MAIRSQLDQRIYDVNFAWKRKRLEELEKKDKLSNKERFEFRLLAGKPSDKMSKVIVALVFLRLAKTPEGLRVIRELGKEFIKGIFGTMHALGQASAANKVAAWANPYLISLVLDRFGFIPDGQAEAFHLGLGLMAGAEVAEGFWDNVSQFLPWNKGGEPSEYPSTINFSSMTSGDKVTETVEAKGLTQEQMLELKKALKP